MSNEQFDVIVVGAGVAGALTAKRLTQSGLKVLVLEAGPSSPKNLSGYEEHLRHFYLATSKGPESAWPMSDNAPQPDTANIRFNNGYFVQNGPQLYGSSYSRLQGGSTLHWLGVSLRMLPEDFSVRTRFGVGKDWPLTYDDIEPYYCQAEEQLGVSANADEQGYLGIRFSPGYDFPMERVPLSYSDKQWAQAVDGLEVSIGETTVPIKIRSYPAARNSMPRGDYQPVGALDTTDQGRVVARNLGERCQGNTSCTPICPVQAKYNAGKSLAQAVQQNLEVRAQCVVSRINTDSATGEVTSVTYLQYDGATHQSVQVQAKAYVLAAHAVENAKLMLNSGLEGPKQLVGRHLMDHPTLYAWGLAAQPVWPFRGPLSTSGIEELRSGEFRAKHAAFRFDVGNDGWRAPAGAPDTLVKREVLRKGHFGSDLRQRLSDSLSRQVRFSLAVEQLPDPENRVTIDRRFVDRLGNPRPSIHYRIDDYTLGGMAAATRVSRAIFERAGVEDFSQSEMGGWFPSVQHEDVTFHYHGMGHFAGTHLMGADADSSVVNSDQQSWQHHNLYLVGSGSFPTMGTSNPTLTLAALALRTADSLVTKLARAA